MFFSNVTFVTYVHYFLSKTLPEILVLSTLNSINRHAGLATARVHIQPQGADHVAHRFDGRIQVVIGLAAG